MEIGTLAERLQRKGDARHQPERMLWSSLPWQWRMAAHVGIPGLNAGDSWFVERRLIAEVLSARSCAQVFGAVDRFHYRGMNQIPWSRRVLGLRVSGRRLIAIARGILPENSPIEFFPTTWGSPFSTLSRTEAGGNPGDQQVAAVAEDAFLDRAADPSDPVERA